MGRSKGELISYLGSQKGSDDTDAMVELGRIYMKEEDIDNAKKWFIKARERGDHRGGLYLNRIAERNEPVYKVISEWSDSKTGDKKRIL